MGLVGWRPIPAGQGHDLILTVKGIRHPFECPDLGEQIEIIAASLWPLRDNQFFTAMTGVEFTTTVQLLRHM